MCTGGFANCGGAESGGREHVQRRKLAPDTPHPGSHCNLRQPGGQCRKTHPENQQGEGAVRIGGGPEGNPDLERADDQRHPPLCGSAKLCRAKLGAARDEGVHNIVNTLAQQVPGYDPGHHREGRIRPGQRDHATGDKEHREQGV